MSLYIWLFDVMVGFMLVSVLIYVVTMVMVGVYLIVWFNGLFLLVLDVFLLVGVIGVVFLLLAVFVALA